MIGRAERSGRSRWLVLAYRRCVDARTAGALVGLISRGRRRMLTVLSPQVLDAGGHDAIDSGDSPSGCGVTPPPLIAGLCVLDSSGARATNPTGIDPIAVTVDSIGVGTPGSACAGGGPNGLDPNATTERFVLRASGSQQWTVYVLGAAAAKLAAGDSI